MLERGRTLVRNGELHVQELIESRITIAFEANGKIRTLRKFVVVRNPRRQFVAL